MRDYPDQPTAETETTTAGADEPRGLEAAERDKTPVAGAGGIWFEIFEGPAKSPAVELAYRATKIGLAGATVIAFVLAVWTLLTT